MSNRKVVFVAYSSRILAAEATTNVCIRIACIHHTLRVRPFFRPCNVYFMHPSFFVQRFLSKLKSDCNPYQYTKLMWPREISKATVAKNDSSILFSLFKDSLRLDPIIKFPFFLRGQLYTRSKQGTFILLGYLYLV